MLGNGVVGILSESSSPWERRAPLTPAHCARLLLLSGREKLNSSGDSGGNGGVRRIIVQPSPKRIFHDAQYEDVGCEISDDLSECGLILGVKQPKIDMIFPNRAYAFFSHTHKAQTENMPLLDKILAERVTLYDYERIVGNDGKRMLAFGKFAGRAGFIDFLHSLGRRYLHLGYSTPFLSLGASHMYTSLAAAKSAVIAVGEEIATLGLPSGIAPVTFVFTGTGNVSQGALEIFKLLPHSFVDACDLPELVRQSEADAEVSKSTKRVFQVYGCVVTCEDMVAPKDSTVKFNKHDYYEHPENYLPVFHEKISPYASAIINCMYWEKKYPRLLSTKQFQELMSRGCPLVGISDITCDIGGSIEFINRTTSIDNPFFRYEPFSDSYHEDMEGDGVICSSVDILPTEFSREASQHFGDILCEFVGGLASTKNIEELPSHLMAACIAHKGSLTSMYRYITRIRNSSAMEPLEYSVNDSSGMMKFSTLISLTGHLFDKFLINEALDIIETAGGSFHLVNCQVGQSADAMSYSELEVGAESIATLNQIINSLTSLANPSYNNVDLSNEKLLSLKVGDFKEEVGGTENEMKKRAVVLIIGAGRVCRPAAEFLASVGINPSKSSLKMFENIDIGDIKEFEVVVASLYKKDAEETIQGIANAKAIELDITDRECLSKSISQAEVVLSLLPPNCHVTVANVCIEHKKHLVTTSYVDDSMSTLDEKAKHAGITILCEMGLDPGIDHMMAMKMINEAHARKGKVKSFVSYCGGLPSPAAANNPLAYKFSWNPAGAIRAGRNSATYKSHGDVVHVDGKELYNSAVSFRIPDLPAFALEYLPNRNSLVYGDFYGISKEASTIFRATLRYEGFSDIMACLANIGLFDTETVPMLKEGKRLTYRDFFKLLIQKKTQEIIDDEGIIRTMVMHGLCKDDETAARTLKTIKFLGLNDDDEIPVACHSAFDVACFRMEERLSYGRDEHDMVLLHHEVEVEFPDGIPAEKHRATLLEFGRTQNGKTTTAMALTVGVPAAIGTLLLLQNKVGTRGVVRPLEPEVYIPAIDILEDSGIKLMEKVEVL